MSKDDYNKIIDEADEYILLIKSGSNYSSYLSKNFKVIADKLFSKKYTKKPCSKEKGLQSTNGLNHLKKEV